MVSVIKFITTALAVLVSTSSASVPSFGLQTAASIRTNLSDAEFKIDPARNRVIDTRNFRVEVADLSVFPALAGTDVQAQITRVTVRAGQSFIPHQHPRSSEVHTVLRGVFEVSFMFEGQNPRVVRNRLRAGQSTVFPQGLPHLERCVSKTSCQFQAVFGSADPGFVPVSM